VGLDASNLMVGGVLHSSGTSSGIFSSCLRYCMDGGLEGEGGTYDLWDIYHLIDQTGPP